MNTYRTLYHLIVEKVKELQTIISIQGKALEEQRKALLEKDMLIDELKRRLKLK